VKIKLKSINFKWLPPAEEWDFRSLPESECRVACHWEYARQDSRSMPKFPNGQNYFPQNYRQAARELFPQAWLTLTPKQREKVLASFFPSPAMQVRKLGDFLKRVTHHGVSSEIPRPYLERAYVMVPDFTGHGVEAVIKKLETWARQEAKAYPQSRRAQAAELPFDALKWLAVLRIDEARRQANVTIEAARETVTAYGLKYGQDHSSSVFPNYSSDGGWSKARTDALKCQTQSKNNPSLLLAELA
jgi:hypothetical protein